MPSIPRTVAAFLFLSIALSCAAAAADAPAKPDPAAPLRIHILSGSAEYKSDASLKAFQQLIEKEYKVTCTASWGKDSSATLPDLDKLRDAELMLVFTRRLKLPQEQMALIRAHWNSGKAIVGLRTASHAFQQADNETFDRLVMGGNYKGHYGDEAIKIEFVASEKDHPILKGVRPFPSGKLYKAGELAKDAVPLLTGDIGKPDGKHNIAWVHAYKGGRVFYSSLGNPEDFDQPDFRRLLLNAVFWTTHRDGDKMKK